MGVRWDDDWDDPMPTETEPIWLAWLIVGVVVAAFLVIVFTA